MRACVANSDFSGPSSLSDLAASSTLSDKAFLRDYIETNRQLLAQNYQLATGFLRKHNIPYKEGSNAGLFVWADLFAPNQAAIDSLVKGQEEGLKSMEAKMTDMLLKNKIFVTAGNDFGTDVSGWYRVVFAHREKYLLEGLERMVRAIQMFGVELMDERAAGAP